jgi:hypothetical protein
MVDEVADVLLDKVRRLPLDFLFQARLSEKKRTICETSQAVAVVLSYGGRDQRAPGTV